jgi:cobalt/nickel transport system permease protein
MHISEGVLSTPVLMGGALITLTGAVIGIRSIDPEKIMSVALFSSVFFVASFIHVPVGPVSIHLLLSGLLGLILGWAAFPAILAALFLQAVLFQYGGLLVLGVNTAIISIPAVFFGLIMKSGLHSNVRKRFALSFIAGSLPILLSSLIMAGCLILSHSGFQDASLLVVLWNIPVAILEGIITAFTVGFLARVQPEILSFSSRCQS